MDTGPHVRFLQILIEDKDQIKFVNIDRLSK